MRNTIKIILLGLWLIGCSSASENHLQLEIYQTSSAGDKLKFITPAGNQDEPTISIKLNPAFFIFVSLTFCNLSNTKS